MNIVRLAAAIAAPSLLVLAPPAIAKSATGLEMSTKSNQGRILREFARAGRAADEKASPTGQSHANENAGFGTPTSP